MALGSGLSANPHPSQPSLEEEIEPQTLDGNRTLRVGSNASLTFGNESLIILGDYILRLTIPYVAWSVMGHVFNYCSLQMMD